MSKIDVVLFNKDSTDYLGNLILKNSHPSQYLFDGGYANFDADTLDGWHYYVQDYMGNNRMVVNARTNSVEQETHYYLYGGVIGDLSTDENLQAYKFENKELDRTFGLDWYDIQARQYDAIGVPSWNAVDPLAEKYYGISPYVYCAGDPVNYVDLDGLKVKPNDDFSFSALKNTLPKAAQQYIVCNNNGYIDLSVMKQYQGDSENYQTLLALVESSIDIQITSLSKTNYITNDGKDYPETFGPTLIEEDFRES